MRWHHIWLEHIFWSHPGLGGAVCKCDLASWLPMETGISTPGYIDKSCGQLRLNFDERPMAYNDILEIWNHSSFPREFHLLAHHHSSPLTTNVELRCNLLYSPWIVEWRACILFSPGFWAVRVREVILKVTTYYHELEGWRYCLLHDAWPAGKDGKPRHVCGGRWRWRIGRVVHRWADCWKS